MRDLSSLLVEVFSAGITARWNMLPFAARAISHVVLAWLTAVTRRLRILTYATRRETSKPSSGLLA